MKKLIPFVFLFLFLIVVVSSAQPATRADAQWENIKALTQGTKISVDTVLGRGISGKFVRVTDRALHLTQSNEEIRLNRENIKAITAPGRVNWKSPAFFSAIGFVIGAACANYFVRAYSGGYDTASDRFVATMLGGLGGAGAGLKTANSISPPDPRQVLYESD